MRTFVQTGNRVDGRAEILKGLKPGDRVVAVGQLKLQSGAAVAISTDPAAADSGAAAALLDIDTALQGRDPAKPGIGLRKEVMPNRILTEIDLRWP